LERRTQYFLLSKCPDMNAKPTAAGIKRKMRKRLRTFREEHSVKAGLLARYKKWSLDHNVECLEEPSLSRQNLHRYLAVLTGHGDFAWYYPKFWHEDAELEYGCGHQKTPEQLAVGHSAGQM
jgi:hypothetical protein